MRSMILPGCFVLLWSSGFIASRSVMPYADPVIFLTLRFILAGILMGGLAAAARVKWPQGRMIWHNVVVGFLVQGVYLWGLYTSYKLGLPAAIGALINGLQPLLTGILAGMMVNERVSPKQIIGLLLGLIGIVIVLFDRIAMPNLTVLMMMPVSLSLVAITVGTLYQKRFGDGGDLRSTVCVQYCGCSLIFIPLNLWEQGHIDWNASVYFGLFWMVMVMSLMTISLYYYLIRRGSAATVSSLMYLAPPTTAIQAWLILDEKIGLFSIIGMGVVAIAVALVMQGERTNTPKPVSAKP